MADVLAGIFVGGASSRMGTPKGLLRTASGVTLVDRWRALFDELGIEHVLVGVRPEYASVPLRSIADDPSGIGPIGGLAALLSEAGARCALAVACDMPFVTRDDVTALIEAPRAPIAAPRRAGRWEPLCARYAPEVRALVGSRIAAGRYALQGLLEEAGAVEVALPSAHLDDWDTPQDRETSES
ncbi:MAG TPA: molybdenum cofactor guanylyltransferase [Sandaracinaceae bacterium]